MTCKSHVLIVVLALLALAPDDVHVWQALPDRDHSTLGANMGAALADGGVTPDGHYQCGLGPFMVYLAGAFFLGLLTLVTYAVGRTLRQSRIRRTRPEEISMFLAKTVLTQVMRLHFIISALGFAAMFVAFGIDAVGYGILLAMLSVVVLSRADISRTALSWLDSRCFGRTPKRGPSRELPQGPIRHPRVEADLPRCREHRSPHGVRRASSRLISRTVAESVKLLP